MVAALVTAAVVAVMFHIVMQEGGFPADRAGRIRPSTWFAGLADRRIGGELMAAFPAEILLKPIFIFAVTIKRICPHPRLLLHFGQ